MVINFIDLKEYIIFVITGNHLIDNDGEALASILTVRSFIYKQ